VNVADQPIRVVVEKHRSGCGTVLAVLFLVGLAVEYWYVTVALVAIAVVIAVARSSRQRELNRRRPGPRDPWLNEVAVALADHGLVEVARNTGGQLGGAPLEGDIGLEADRLAVWVHLFATPGLAREADVGLRAQSKVREAVAEGRTVIRASGRILILATGRGGIVDDFRLDEVLQIVGKLTLPAPLTPAKPPAHGRPASRPAADATGALEQVQSLAALRDAGIITEPEFEAKKAELLARI
jgi:hypothetical protein